MARIKRYTDQNVYEAALSRLEHIYDTHDRVIVCFSGGKDSLAALHLALEVHTSRGINTPLDVVFRDEELIPDEVIAFVDKYRNDPRFKMLWFAVPLKSSKFVLGKSIEYVQWDALRDPENGGVGYVRPRPLWSLTANPGEVFDQYTMDQHTATYYPNGKLAFITGIRAAESLIRFRSSVEKLNENYINSSTSPRVSLCKPIYDWQEDDVFYYFYQNNVPYCDIYDIQNLAGEQFRVATPIHAENAKRQLQTLRASLPEFHQRVMAIFPEMLLQERYWKQVDRKAMKAKYGTTYEGCQAYIDEMNEPKQKAKAQEMFDKAMARAGHMPDAYPPQHVFQWLSTGSFKRQLMPKN